jgi:phosphoacetylglucosamine mutase
MLVMEAILFDMDMSIQQFSEIYQENPSKLYKIVVSDRTKFKTNADESRLVEPLAL